MNELRDEKSLEATDELWALANGPGVIVNLYSGCISNGVRFHIKDRDNRRRTQNSGLVVEGEYNGESLEFYGSLGRVWVLYYMMGYKVVLFHCEWYDSGHSRTCVTDAHVTSIDIRSRWYKNDPFVLPSQVRQVFYINDTKLNRGGDYWKVVERLQHRGLWDISEVDHSLNTDEPLDAFQQEETTNGVPIIVEDPIEFQFHRDDIEPETSLNDYSWL